MVEKKTTKRRSAEEIAAAKKAEEEQKSKNLLEDIYGELMDLTEDEDHFFPSGSLVIDSVLSNGKGIPLGKFISITAAEGVGKSSMCLHIARNCCAKGYRCLYIDTEVGVNASQIESFSMTPFVENRTFIVKGIRTYRELDALLEAVPKDPNLKFIFLDSLTDVIPDQIMENNISDMNQPGLDARAQALLLRKHKYALAKAGVTVFFILQQRTKIGMKYGERTFDQAAGGHAARHAMDISLELTKKESLSRMVKGHDDPVPYGSECLLKATKNRYAPPMIPMQIQIIFGKGVSNSGAVASALILNGIAKTPTKTKYVIDYQGEEVTCISKAKFNEFIKSHLDYYKNIVEDCGGIRLLPDSEIQQPTEVLEENPPIKENMEDSDDYDEEDIMEEEVEEDDSEEMNVVEEVEVKEVEMDDDVIKESVSEEPKKSKRGRKPKPKE